MDEKKISKALLIHPFNFHPLRKNNPSFLVLIFLLTTDIQRPATLASLLADNQKNSEVSAFSILSFKFESDTLRLSYGSISTPQNQSKTETEMTDTEPKKEAFFFLGWAASFLAFKAQAFTLIMCIFLKRD